MSETPQVIGQPGGCTCCNGSLVHEGFELFEVPEWYKADLPINPPDPKPPRYFIVAVNRATKQILVEHVAPREAEVGPEWMRLRSQPDCCTIVDFLACYVMPALNEKPEEEESDGDSAG